MRIFTSVSLLHLLKLISFAHEAITNFTTESFCICSSTSSWWYKCSWSCLVTSWNEWLVQFNWYWRSDQSRSIVWFSHQVGGSESDGVLILNSHATWLFHNQLASMKLMPASTNSFEFRLAKLNMVNICSINFPFEPKDQSVNMTICLSSDVNCMYVRVSKWLQKWKFCLWIVWWTIILNAISNENYVFFFDCDFMLLLLLLFTAYGVFPCKLTRIY